MTAIEVESVEADSPAKHFEDCGHISWNDSQTRILITHFKDNPILWDKQLKDNAAILFFPMHEHKEFCSLSLICPTFDFVARTCFIISWHHWKTLERFVPWDVSNEVQQVEVC